MLQEETTNLVRIWQKIAAAFEVIQMFCRYCLKFCAREAVSLAKIFKIGVNRGFKADINFKRQQGCAIHADKPGCMMIRCVSANLAIRGMTF